MTSDYSYLSVCEGLSMIRARRRLRCSSRTMSSLLVLLQSLITSRASFEPGPPAAEEGLKGSAAVLAVAARYFSAGIGTSKGRGVGTGMKKGNGRIMVGGGNKGPEGALGLAGSGLECFGPEINTK